MMMSKSMMSEQDKSKANWGVLRSHDVMISLLINIP